MLPHSLTIRAPAKINLFLHILDQKPNGYHELQTLFQFISLYDTLSFSPRTDLRIVFDSNIPGIPDEQQLVVKAAHLLQSYGQSPCGVNIHLDKRIPMAAGLGGGSSDAASTLLALNRLWDCRLPLTALLQLGVQLGADVPVFIYGHSAFAGGIGEQLSQATPSEAWYVIAKPDCSIATAALFQHPALPRHTRPMDFGQYDYDQTHNDCEALARTLYPEVEAVCQWLGAFGKPRLTGTGACVFLPLTDLNLWPVIEASCPQNCQVWLCQGLNRSPAWLDLAEFGCTPVHNE